MSIQEARSVRAGSQEPAHCSSGGAVGAARGMSKHEAGSAQKMEVGSQEPVHCSRGGAVGAASPPPHAS